MAYQMYLSVTGENPMQIPVLPDKIGYDSKGIYKTTDIQGLGEITLTRGSTAPLSLNWESEFPSWIHASSIKEGLLEPKHYVYTIKRWKDQGKKVRVLITFINFNLLCTIDDFSFEEVGGDVTTYKYKISFKEFRGVQTRRVYVDVANGIATIPEETLRVDTRLRDIGYIVMEGDYLRKISQKVYGNPEAWIIIAEANQLQPPWEVKEGDRLRIPGEVE